MPKIEILHGRDPDSSCEISVWVDGVRVTDVTEIDIDPGAGWLRTDWDERIETTRADPNLTPEFRDIAVRTLESFSGSKYIIEED